jgi:hypothetical protein
LAALETPKNVSTSDGKGTVPLDGVSLAPILFDRTTAVRDPNEGYLLAETLDLMKNSTRQVGARNATYKVVCTNGTGADNCEFYNLIADPLEEYPLAKPAGCDDYSKGIWKPVDPQWHYCRLTQVVKQHSFL